MCFYFYFINSNKKSFYNNIYVNVVTFVIFRPSLGLYYNFNIGMNA